MIRLIQNAQTRQKGTLNFMDQNGKVVGFNPRPDGTPLSFYVYDVGGNEVDTSGQFIETYLDGISYQFGNDGKIIKHDKSSDEDDRLVISLLPDTGSGLPPLSLHIVCMNSLYYTADFVLSDKDRLAIQKPPRAIVEVPLETLDSLEKTILQTRLQLGKALEEIEQLRVRVGVRRDPPPPDAQESAL